VSLAASFKFARLEVLRALLRMFCGRTIVVEINSITWYSPPFFGAGLALKLSAALND